MKKFSVSVLLLALGLALLLTSVPTKNVGAKDHADDPGKSAARRKDGKIVAPDGVVFESAKDFIDAGRKCRTRHVDDLEMEEIDEKVKSHRAADGRAPSGGGGSGEAARIYPNGSINIPVYFHVVYRSDGVGNIAESWLDNQIAAMNEHYSGGDTPAYRTAASNTSFRFVEGRRNADAEQLVVQRGSRLLRGNRDEECIARRDCR